MLTTAQSVGPIGTSTDYQRDLKIVQILRPTVKDNGRKDICCSTEGGATDRQKDIANYQLPDCFRRSYILLSPSHRFSFSRHTSRSLGTTKTHWSIVCCSIALKESIAQSDLSLISVCSVLTAWLYRWITDRYAYGNQVRYISLLPINFALN